MGPANASSITHSLNASVATGADAGAPPAATRARSASSAAGVMRSTIVGGIGMPYNDLRIDLSHRGQGEQRGAQRLPVRGQVVATHHGRRRLAPRQPVEQDARRRPGRAPLAQRLDVAGHRVPVQAPVGAQAVSLLRHRQRDERGRLPRDQVPEPHRDLRGRPSRRRSRRSPRPAAPPRPRSPAHSGSRPEPWHRGPRPTAATPRRCASPTRRVGWPRSRTRPDARGGTRRSRDGRSGS